MPCGARTETSPVSRGACDKALTHDGPLPGKEREHECGARDAPSDSSGVHPSSARDSPASLSARSCPSRPDPRRRRVTRAEGVIERCPALPCPALPCPALPRRRLRGFRERRVRTMARDRRRPVGSSRLSTSDRFAGRDGNRHGDRLTGTDDRIGRPIPHRGYTPRRSCLGTGPAGRHGSASDAAVEPERPDRPAPSGAPSADGAMPARRAP